MSRGFVKEGDSEETPLVAPRAHLPEGVTNYVTTNGLEELLQEQNSLEVERTILLEQSAESNRVQINYITAKIYLLEERINSAKVVELLNQPQNKIHFGATITLFKINEKVECQYQIVGVDEANVSKNKISFLSPLAKVLLNKKLGDVIALQTPRGERLMKIQAVEYY